MTSKDAEQLKLEGNELFKAAKYKKALEKYNEACQLSPSVPAYWSNASACYEKLQDFNGMKRSAERCIEADKNFAKGYFRLAIAQKELEELGEAKETVEKALTLHDKNEDFQLLKLQIENLVDLIKCNICGNPDTTSVCSRCHVQSYCSRECQKAGWSEHKKTCEPPSTSLFVNCQNCMTLIKTLRVCSKCKNAYYCSRKCQLQHFSQHKPTCDRNKRAKDVYAGRGLPSDLFGVWRRRADICIGLFATHAMTKKQFMEQPPSFVVSISVAFNYNFMTYLPEVDPRVVAIVDLDQNVRANVESQISLAVSKAQAHAENMFAHVFLITDANSEMSSVMPHLNAPGAYQRYPREDIELLIREEVNLNPGQLQLWRPVFEQNMKAQLNALKMADSTNWTFFLLNSLRVYSTQPRYKTHALLVDYDLGFGLGQIDRVTKYKVVKLEEARNLFRNNPQLPRAAADHMLQSLDVENSPKLVQSRAARPRNVLLVVIFRANKSKNVLLADSSLYELEAGMTKLAPKKCDKKADECFRRLQAVSLPDVSSPDLVNVKPTGVL
jgi:tetratricopeptide (TPR) repeat protein